MIHVTINGKETSLEDGMTISALIKKVNFQSQNVTVKLNNSFLEAQLFERVLLKDGDDIELRNLTNSGTTGVKAASSILELIGSTPLVRLNKIVSPQMAEVYGKYDIPYNILHDKGYPSIGCEPCTRAIKPGEDLRAGRWWWEQADQKECGLHHQK